MSSDFDKRGNKRICYQCVGEDFLSSEIKAKGRKLKCSYCHTVRNCYLINKVADRIETAFNDHFTRSSAEPSNYQLALMNDKESDYEWYQDGEPVLDAIMNAAEIPERAAQDVQSILEDKYLSRSSEEIGEETEFSADTYYEEKPIDDRYWKEEWNNFETTLKEESRYSIVSVQITFERFLRTLNK